jgi:hypothetical protein
VDTRTDGQVQEFLDWSASHAQTGRAGRPGSWTQVDGHSRLDRMEEALRACTLWLWLDLRFPGVYGHVDEVLALRSQLNDGIERQLKGKRPLAQVRPQLPRVGLGLPGGGTSAAPWRRLAQQEPSTRTCCPGRACWWTPATPPIRLRQPRAMARPRPVPP